MRSKLFMAGDKPELFPAALASGADVISIDLEDTVTRHRKNAAREAVSALLRRMSDAERARVLVRVNSVESGLLEDDLGALEGSGLTLLNLPKPESVDEVRAAESMVDRFEAASGTAQGAVRLLLNVESPRGLRRMFDIAESSRRASGLQIGYADLLEPFGIDREHEAAMTQIRLSVRWVAAELGLQAFDGVYAGLDDDAFFRRECLDAKRLGFAGKSCFNPAQVAIANDTFQPSAEAIARAHRIVESSAKAFSSGEGIYVLDGRIVDEPFVAGARQVLARAAALGL